MSTSKKRFSEEEIKFIENNYKVRTDSELAKILNRTELSIARQRAIHGWKKDNGRPSAKKIKENLITAAAEGFSPMSFSGLSKDQRIEIYKQQFDKNPRYMLLRNELYPEELEYYKHKYVEFMDGVDTITLQEEDALHHMIMNDISISRMRKKIIEMERSVENGDSKIINYGLYTYLKDFEDKFISYQKTLRVTREGRLKEDKEQKETFATLVQAYRNRATREELGNQAALMDVYKSKCQEDMKASRYLLGETGI